MNGDLIKSVTIDKKAENATYISSFCSNTSEYTFKKWNDVEVYTEPDKVRKQKKTPQPKPLGCFI